MTLSKTSGTLAPGQTDTVAVSINSAADGLAVGSYTDTVSFTNTTNGNGNCSRPVSLTVQAGLVVTPTDGLVSSGPAGGPFSPADFTWTLRNTSASSLNWTAHSSVPFWASLSKTSGTLAAGATDTVTVSIAGVAATLAPYRYTGSINF